MNELVKFDPVKAEMAEFRQENALLIFNYEDPQGNKDARSHIFKLRKIKTVIADIHKEAKAHALGVCKLLDKEKRELTAEVEEWIDVHYKPVKEIEEREVKAAAVKANAERLEAIRLEAERTAERERREEELAAKETALKEKEDALAYEQERLEAAKQAEINKQEAVKAAQEQAERDKVAATAKVEQDRKDALAAAEAAKQAAVEVEQERQRKEAEAAQAEAERLAAVERKRITDTAHRENIEADILSELETLLEDDDKADNVLQHLKAGYVPHVTINY